MLVNVKNYYTKIIIFQLWVFIILLTVIQNEIIAACCNDIGTPTSAPIFGTQGIAYSPDGTCLAVSDSFNNQINIYSVTPGVCGISNLTPIHQITAGINNPRGVAFSPDGNCLAITSLPNEVFIYSMTGCTPSSSPVATITNTGSNPTLVSFSPTCLAVKFDTTNTVSLYSMTNCTPSALPTDTISSFPAGVSDIKFSPDGTCLAIALFSTGFRLYNITNCISGTFTSTTLMQINSLAFSSSGLCLAAHSGSFFGGGLFLIFIL